MKTTTKTVLVKDIKANLFVRQTLDQDHVMYLAELMQNSVKMTTPIKVTTDLTLIDGRHRKEAYELNDIKEIEVEIVEASNEVELIAMAYKANVGGSLHQAPSTRSTRLCSCLIAASPRRASAKCSACRLA